MSLSNNFPAIKPSLNLDFANVKALDPRISFVRTTTATYYDGVTTAKAEENLLLQSQDFTTSWTNPGTTDTANTEVAPDGTTTADTITEDLTSGGHSVNQAVTFIASTPYTASVFLKAGTNNYAGIIIRTNTSSDYHGVVCDLSTGTITQTNTVDFTSAGSSITSVGNGWYRVVITATSPSSISGGNLNIYMADSATPASFSNGIPSYTGTGADIYAWGAQLEQRSAVTSYTPTTTQSITNYIPALQTAASGVARFDHNPTTGESLGLLVEEQRTNNFTYSDDFSNAAWAKTRSSITANTIVAPDGTLTGDKLVEDTTASNTHLTRQDFTLAVGTYTYSFFAKAAERTIIQCVRSNTNIDLITHTFNLSTGVATGTGASMVAVGNNWYRCIGVITVNTASSTGINFTLNDGSTITYTGDGYSGIYLWGAQLEAGAFPTSYIPTTSASVTRNADAASMTGTNFSSWFRADEGTLYAEASTTLSSPKISITDDTNSNRFLLDITSTNSRFLIQRNGVTEAGPTITYQSGFLKNAYFYQTNAANIAQNGILGTQDNSVNLPVVNRMYIGGGSTGGVAGVNYIKKFSYYPIRVTDAQLQALTS